jgi:glycosyltransferase involved in cell wall biosynthesis
MRIAFVCMDPGVPIFGSKGCSVHVQEVVREFARRGAAVTVFATRSGGIRSALPRNCDIRLLAPVAASDPAERERHLLELNEPLCKLLPKTGPFDFVYERYSLWSFAAMEYARTVGVPALLEVNGPLIDEQAAVRRLIDLDRARESTERSFQAADVLLAVSSQVADYLARWPSTNGRVHVVKNGVDVNRVKPDRSAARRRASDPFTIGFVGTLKRWHALGVLVDAFDRIHRSSPTSRLLVVGTGPAGAALVTDLVQRGLLGATELTGAVTRDLVPALLASIDVAVVPARSDEQYYFSPLKIFEYMAAGLPIVAARIGQIAEVIEHEVNGLLCEPGDGVEMAAAIDRLRRDPALAARLGAAARETVVRSHTWAHTVDRILDLVRVSQVSRRVEV